MLTRFSQHFFMPVTRIGTKERSEIKSIRTHRIKKLSKFVKLTTFRQKKQDISSFLKRKELILQFRIQIPFFSK